SSIFICPSVSFFFFNAPSTPAIYTLSLHDALPIFIALAVAALTLLAGCGERAPLAEPVTVVFKHARMFGDDPVPRLVAAFEARQDRKSTRLNSSHVEISYAVFCLKKKKKK